MDLAASDNSTDQPGKRIAIFASGSGSNAQKIIEHFLNHPAIKVSLIVCNVPTAGVIQRAATYNVPVLLINKDEFLKGNGYIPDLKDAQIDFIVLAGFLWKVPEALIEAFRNKIVNIHPALLPKFGGKGMYGLKVHQAVIDAGEKESGITIHYVDEHYDHGDSILQAKCRVYDNDTAETLASRIHQLEHEHYPKTIEKLLLQ
jgi:phosphoribosylglycinamide formyltransferase 1